MGDVATELEDIYDILGSSSATSEQRKLSYDAFERIKKNDESFAGAKEVIRRRKSEGSVYTALLVIEYHICNNWTKIYKFYNIDSFITDVVRQAAELNSSLIISGVANVAYQALSRHAKLINSLHANLVGSDLLRVEIFFVTLEKTASAVLDYNQKMSLETREYLREYLKENCLILFSRAQEKINIAHVENELYSPRVISNIYSTVAMLISSDSGWAKQLLDDSALSQKFISLSYLLLDKFNQKYHQSIASFLRNYSERALFRNNYDYASKFLVTEDHFLSLSNFVKCTVSHTARYESSQLLFNIIRIITQYHSDLTDMYPKYIFDVLSAFVVFEDPSINCTIARCLQSYSYFLNRNFPQIFSEHYDTAVDIFIKVVVNQKKCEYSVAYNSIGDENQLLKDTEIIIYRFCMNVFSIDQQRSALVGIKYGCKLIESCLYDDAMNNCDYSGIAFALRNISWVTELGNYYFWKDIPHSTGSVKEIVSMSELMLNQLIKASLKNLKQLNCFIDISHCLIQYFCFVPTLWPEYLKQLHSHVLGMVDASKEYLVLNIDSLYWLRKSNKCLFQLFKSIFARIKMDRKLTDVMNSFCAIVADVAFNLCIFDWLEREHIEIYTTVKNTIEDTEMTSPSSISSYMNVIKEIMTNQELISGLSGVDSFLLYFGIGDDVLRPQVVVNLKKLFQTISITTVYFVDLKLIDSSKKLLENPELNQFKFAVVEIYRFFLQIWRCFCDLWNLQVVCQRSPQLVKAIQRSNRRMIECSYEQRFAGFENMELRLQAFGKNLIRCLSSIFLFSMKNYSDSTIYVTNSFYSDVWKPFLALPFFFIPNFISLFFTSYFDHVKDINVHSKFIVCFSQIFQDLNSIITARSTFIRTEFHTMETSSCLEEGNWLVEASNITDDVNMAVTYFCLRVIDLSSLINVEILKNITDKTPLDPATLSKFESLIYTDHSTWISLIKLLFTLIAYGSSKTIIRICDHSYIQNHLKLRLAHFQDNSQFYDGLITHMLNCLYIAYSGPHTSHQASLALLNLFVYIISLYRSIYKPLDHTFQEITAFPSQVVLTEKLNIICSETLPLKNKRQALYSILNKITTDEENVEMLVDQIEKLSVAETNVNKRPSIDTEDKPLNDLDLIEIRFLFE